VIERVEKPWGVRFTVQPLTDRPEMKIIAEVNRPKGDKRPETRYWFDGVPTDRPLRSTELSVWNQSMRQILDVVKDESAAAMKNRKRKR